MAENEAEIEQPKLSKTEEKESFLKRLEERTNELKKVEERIQSLVDRNEELAARNLLGGRSDAGIQAEPVKEISNAEYAQAVKTGKIKFTS